MAPKAKPAPDYKAILSRLNDQSKRGGGGDQTYMDLVEGDNVVRLLPGHPNMDTFFAEVFYHRKEAGKKSYQVICLNGGDPRAGLCPICEELEELRTSKDKRDKELFNKQRPKQRFYLNALDRGDNNTHKILPVGITVMKKILKFVTDEDEYGDILDLEDGTDLVIERTGEGLDTEYDVKARRKTSPALPPKDIKKLIGTNATDTKLFDLSEKAAQFQGEEDKVLLVWEGGWEALKEAEDSSDDKGKKKSKKSKPVDDEEEEEEAPKKKSKKAPAKHVMEEEEEDEDEDEDEPVKPVKKAPEPPKKSKKPAPPVDEDEDEDEEEEEGEIPPPKKSKKAPEPPKKTKKQVVVEEEEEEEEEEKPAPKKAKKAKPVEEDEDDDGLGELDDVLARHRTKMSKKGK